jgi:hypothetical protein
LCSNTVVMVTDQSTTTNVLLGIYFHGRALHRVFMEMNWLDGEAIRLHPKLHPIPFIVPLSKEVHYIGSRVPFGTLQVTFTLANK